MAQFFRSVTGGFAVPLLFWHGLWTYSKRITFLSIAVTASRGPIDRGPEIIQEAYAELRKLYLEVASRVLGENPSVVLNRCPKCETLCRTPRSKQCRSWLIRLVNPCFPLPAGAQMSFQSSTLRRWCRARCSSIFLGQSVLF